MALIAPFIHFNGNAEEAFTFYKTVFNQEFSKLMRYKEISSEAYPIPENEENKIMQVSLPTGPAGMIKGSDVLEMMGRVTENDNRNTISVSGESRAEADQIFAKLSTDGTIEMPFSAGANEVFFGMLTDKFGVQWMIDFDPNH